MKMKVVHRAPVRGNLTFNIRLAAICTINSTNCNAKLTEFENQIKQKRHF